MSSESNFLFTKEHEWLNIDGNEAKIGITNFAQGELGDIVFVELPEVGDSFDKDEVFGTIEAVKTVADLFMPVSGEEKGLLGSKYYTDHPIYPLEKTIANLNIDMIGRLDDWHDTANYVYLIGSDRLSLDLHNISENINSEYIGLDLDYRFNAEDDPNRYYYRSDHYNFAKNNIPVIFYFNGVHEDYHRPSDTIEKIDFDKIKTITKLIFLTAWELANRDERIKLKEGL